MSTLLTPARLHPAGVRWCQTTRRTPGRSVGAYAGCNLAGHVGEDPAVTAANWASLARVFTFSREHVATARQVHGTSIHVAARGGHADLEADAVVSATPGLSVGVFTADCVPVLLAAPRRGVVAAVHAGWAGAAGRIVSATVELLATRFGVSPADDLYAWLGAHIAQCSYEVGAEVALRFAGRRYEGNERGRFQLDVGGAVCDELLACGLSPKRLERCGLDTYVESELLYSYRRDGSPTGRMLAAVGLFPET